MLFVFGGVVKRATAKLGAFVIMKTAQLQLREQEYGGSVNIKEGVWDGLETASRADLLIR